MSLPYVDPTVIPDSKPPPEDKKCGETCGVANIPYSQFSVPVTWKFGHIIQQTHSKLSITAPAKPGVLSTQTLPNFVLTNGKLMPPHVTHEFCLLANCPNISLEP